MSIGSAPEHADEGATLILEGTKTLTSSPFWDYPDGKVPFVGALSVLLDGSKKPRGIVETTWVEIMPFARVTTEMARAYGERGIRPCGVIDQRHASAWIFGAVHPGTDQAFALVLTEVGTRAMQAFLGRFSATLLKRVHAALLLDGAGWHIAGHLAVPDNVSLIFLPPYAPELSPVERVWLYLRKRFLSLRLFPDLDAIVDGCCQAWNQLTAEPGRIAFLTNYPYLRSVRTS